MRVGLLRHRVTIQRRKVEKDARGQRADTWVDVATVFAQVVQNNGREQMEAMQRVQEYDYRIHIRARSGVTETDRVIYHDAGGDTDRTLEILAVLDKHQRGRWLELVCKEHSR